jgi:hypothetical protein
MSTAPQDGNVIQMSMKDIIGSLTNTISVVSAAAFVLSVIHETAYFSVVGSKFLSAASLTDYLANALDWLPGAIAILLGYWLVLILSAMASGLAIENDKPTPPRPDGPSGWDKIPFPAIAILGILFFGVLDAFIYFRSDPADRGWLWGTFVMSFAVWFFVLGLAISRAGAFGAMVDDELRLIVLLLPSLAFGAFLWGLHSGYRDVSRPGELYRLTLKDSQRRNPQDVNVLRAFERGVVLRFPESQSNELVRWDDIRSLGLRRDGQAGKSLGCLKLGWSC